VHPADAEGPAEQDDLAKPRRSWRVDRGRRERIVAAAMEVLRDEGLRGLSYRRVAKAAGVPLSATTYYFPTVDALLEATMIEVSTRDAEELRRRLEDVPQDGDVLDTLVEMVMARIGNRTYLVTAVELSVAALRSERLRELVEAWGTRLTDDLSPRMDPLTAGALVAAIDGICLHSVLAATAPSREEVAAIMRRTIAGG
jgi:DNA-binding transcriptional regulator YbjK